MKFTKLTFITIAALTLPGCGNLNNVSKEGTAENLIWPNPEDARFNHDGSQFGSWPNWNNVDMIEPGMNKDQIYHLIGRPHFSEGLYGVREWNYVFNYRENGERKICQYKILFNSDMDVGSFHWLPENCRTSYELSGDLLFEFDSYRLTGKGRYKIGQIADTLKSQQNMPMINIAGYTDPLGSDEYNMTLSQQRADSVKQYMLLLGIPADRISAMGYGETNQIKVCNDEQGDELKACLAPNRRVLITTY